MKRLLTACLGLMAVASTAFAQGQQTSPAPDISPLINRPLPRMEGSASVSAPTEEQAYVLFQPIYPNDSARFDLPIPTRFPTGTTEWRGIGTIFAPGKFYEFYSGSVYNETSNIYFDGTNGLTDQTYIDQFQNAGAWSLDTLGMFVYLDPTQNVFPQFSGKILVLKTSQNFYGSNPAAWNGVVGARAGMQVMAEYEITPDSLLTTATVDPNNPDSYSISRTDVGFDPPLSFNAGDAAVILYVNDDAPAVRIDSASGNEVQQVITNLEWKTSKGSVPANQTVDSLPWYKVLGVVMYRPTAGAPDTVFASGTRLTLNINNRSRSAEFGLSRSRFLGTVDLGASGVKYHFGTDAQAQGITAITPNPAREAATVNFALKQAAQVSLDLYDANGTLVRHILDTRYIPGGYSYTLPTSDLPAGNYLVRLTAGDANYSSKLTVVK